MFRNQFFKAYGFWHWGEGFQTVLFTWYMAFHANLSASEIGFYQAVVLSPFLIFTIFGGAITDRIGAKRSYLISTSLFAALLIGYGLLEARFGFHHSLFFLYCVGAGLVSAISNPAIDTFIPEATTQSVQNNSLLAATAHNIAKLTGNISALLLPVLMATGGFVVNGILMAISVAFLRTHHGAPRPVDAAPQTRNRMFHRIVTHYRSCPENFDIILSSAMLGFIIIPVGYILIPLTLREMFPQHGDKLALIGMSSWVGAILVTTLAQRASARIARPGAMSLLIWGIYGAALLLLLFVPSFAALCLLVMFFGSVKVGKALVYGKYLYNAPNAERGLFVAVDQTAFWGLATLGTAVMGVLVDTIGLTAAITATSGAIVTCVLCLTVRGRLSAMSPA